MTGMPRRFIISKKSGLAAWTTGLPVGILTQPLSPMQKAAKENEPGGNDGKYERQDCQWTKDDGKVHHHRDDPHGE